MAAKLSLSVINVRADPDSHEICPLSAARPSETVRIEGDGNCLFRSLALAVTGSQDSHQELREKIVHFMQKDSRIDRYLNEASTDYIQRTGMQTPGIYGTDAELYASALLLETDIYTYRKDSWQRFSRTGFLTDQPGGCPAVFLVNKNDNHYENVLSVEQTEPIYIFDKEGNAYIDTLESFDVTMDVYFNNSIDNSSIWFNSAFKGSLWRHLIFFIHLGIGVVLGNFKDAYHIFVIFGGFLYCSRVVLHMKYCKRCTFSRNIAVSVNSSLSLPLVWYPHTVNWDFFLAKFQAKRKLWALEKKRMNESITLHFCDGFFFMVRRQHPGGNVNATCFDAERGSGRRPS